MQRRLSAFNGYTIEAPDGNVGYISDILFEDDHWKLRWFVISTGSWLLGQKVLIHPSVLGRPDVRQRAFPVTQTRLQVQANPDISTDPPVTRQMAHNGYQDYAYDPAAGQDYYSGVDFGFSGGVMGGGRQNLPAAPAGDKTLRSIAEVRGYHIHALDGDIGHVEDFLVDDETWQMDSVLIDTKNWGFGKQVLVSVAELKEVNWSGRFIRLALTRYKIRSSPSWQDPDWSDPPAG